MFSLSLSFLFHKIFFYFLVSAVERKKKTSMRMGKSSEQKNEGKSLCSTEKHIMRVKCERVVARHCCDLNWLSRRILMCFKRRKKRSEKEFSWCSRWALCKDKQNRTRQKAKEGKNRQIHEFTNSHLLLYVVSTEKTDNNRQQQLCAYLMHAYAELTVHAECLFVEERHIRCTIFRLAAINCLIIGDVRDDVQFRLHSWADLFWLCIDLERFFCGWNEKEFFFQ